MLYLDQISASCCRKIKYSLGMKNIINYITDQVIAIIRKKIEINYTKFIVNKETHFSFSILHPYIFSDCFARFWSMDRSNDRTFTRSWVRLHSSCVQVTHTPTNEMVCGTSKVHVVVDHGSGNSRLPTVVQVCMNVGHHLYRSRCRRAVERRVRWEKRETRKQAARQVRFRSPICVSFAPPTATGNLPVPSSQCIPSKRVVLQFSIIRRVRARARARCARKGFTNSVEIVDRDLCWAITRLFDCYDLYNLFDHVVL